MKDIFDLTDTKDIPEELLKRIMSKVKDLSQAQKHILELLRIRNGLTYNEFLIGYYRKYGEVVTRNYLHKAVLGLKRRGYVESKPSSKSNKQNVYFRTGSPEIIPKNKR